MSSYGADRIISSGHEKRGGIRSELSVCLQGTAEHRRTLLGSLNTALDTSIIGLDAAWPWCVYGSFEGEKGGGKGDVDAAKDWPSNRA